MKKVLLKIGGMTCSACSSGLEKYLNKQDGIKLASVNLVMNNANIEYDDERLSLQDVEKFVDKAGFESLGIDNFEKEEKKNSFEKYKIILITIFSLIILYISMGSMIGLPEISFIKMMKYPTRFSICLLVFSSIVLFLGKDILRNGFKNLIHKTPNMDTLVTIGVVASMLYSIFGTVMIFKGHSHYVMNLYYESAAIVVFFIKVGKYIEGRNTDKTKEALKELMTITPNHAIIVRDGKEKTVTLDEIQKDDIVVCKPGEKIAVDGTVIDGNTHIDESFITGESVPVKREAGSKIIAGSINYEGTIKYKAEKIGKESTVSEIVRLVVESTSSKAPIAKIADKVSSVFVPVVIAIAIVAFIIWMIISKDIAFAINIFITVLVVACPCSLGLATPLAIIVGSGLATKKGILVKSSESLENAHKVKTVVFDKTGTLTEGKLTVSKIYNYSDIDEAELLKMVASVENKSEHPIARAIVNYAKERKIDIDEVNDFEAVAGMGVVANYESEKIIIGNQKLIDENKIEISNKQDAEELTKDENSILYVALNNKLIALVGVKDTIRKDIVELIEKLKAKNINVVMLTGDNEKTAQNIAKKLKIDKVISNVMPKQKAEEIEKLKQNGLVMMCGDGINDSISLVKADIGVSVSSGTDIARDSAQVVIMNDNLNRINDVIDISKKTVRNIKQNLFWAFFYNVCMIPVACGFLVKFGIMINPMIASLAMTLSSLFVVLNVLKLKVFYK
ncbi:MAG: copper-translocating P-type ATPase [Clostridia bacterium]|nr:copper-translocating P-type ATPase [Clostridia bacterium]